MKILSIITLLTYTISALKWGQFWAFIITPTVVISLLILLLINLLYGYGRQVENSYIFSESENDNSVLRRAKRETFWLELSGNKLGLRVVTFFYQDTVNPNESWEEFQDRKQAGIANDRILHWEDMEKREGREFVLTQMNGQKGVKGFKTFYAKKIN